MTISYQWRNFCVKSDFAKTATPSMPSDDRKRHKRRHDDSEDERDRHHMAYVSLPVNSRDAHAIVSALLETYPDGRDELQELFKTIDEGSSVEIDSIPDLLVRNSLRLLFQCLRLNLQGSSYTLGSSSPNLSSIFESIFRNAISENDRLKVEQPKVVEKEQPKRVIGPTMPPSFADDDDDDDDFGPPVSSDGKAIIVAAAARPSSEMASERAGRESWMTQLPEGRTGVSTAHGLIARSFSRKGIRDVGDQSAWTDTAADKQRKFEKTMADRATGFKEKKQKMMSSKPSSLPESNEKWKPSLLEQYRANPQAFQKESAESTSVWDRERDLVRGTKASLSNLKNIVADANKISSRFSKGSTML